MIDLSHIFYPERSEFDRIIVHKFIPDRTIDRNRLTIVFFQSKVDDYSTSILNGDSDETIVKSLDQLREVANLLDIQTIEIPRHRYNNSIEIIKKKLTRYNQVLFLAITRLDDELVQLIDSLLYSGYKIIIGTCASMVSIYEWKYYQYFQNENKILHRQQDNRRDEWPNIRTPLEKPLEIVHALQFVDILLWEEFRMEFRISKLTSSGIPMIRDIVIPHLRRLKIGEPQLRIHFLEGMNGQYVNEFALETDWEPNISTLVQLSYRESIKQTRKGLIERLFGKSQKIYRFCQTEKDYICLKIFDGHEVVCYFTSVSKDPQKTTEEIIHKYEQFEEKSIEIAREFLERNLETVLQIGTMGNRFSRGGFNPICTLRSTEWSNQHIKKAIRTSIEMIASRAQMWRIDPAYVLFGPFYINILIKRLDEEEEEE